LEKDEGNATTKKLPLIQNEKSCDFTGYDADMLMRETAKLSQYFNHMYCSLFRRRPNR